MYAGGVVYCYEYKGCSDNFLYIVSMNKVTIIGAGMVGSTAAYSIIAKDMVEIIALMDVNTKLAEAQVMDLQHSVPFFGSTRVKVGSYEDCRDSAVAVICAGASQKPGQTRLDLVEQNASIIAEIVPKVFEQNENIVLIMVTNPVDVLTYLAVHLFPEKKRRIMGTGTILDSARFRHLIGEQLSVSPRSIHAYIVGEHGDSEVPFWSSAMTGSMHMDQCRVLSGEEKKTIFNGAKNAAYSIIEGKQATYYAIGAGVAHLVNAVVKNKRVILPVSHLMEGEFDLRDVCLSVPAIIGREGVSGHLCLQFSPEELDALRQSAQMLKKTWDAVCAQRAY